LFAPLWSKFVKTCCSNNVGHYEGDGNKFNSSTLDKHAMSDFA